MALSVGRRKSVGNQFFFGTLRGEECPEKWEIRVECLSHSSNWEREGMSDPVTPLAYYASQLPPKRTVLLSIIAWVAIVFGGFGIFGLFGAVAFLAMSNFLPVFAAGGAQ